MARIDYVGAVKAVLYGQGMGEQPSIVQAAADAAETITSPKIVFNLLAGEGSKIRAGDVLSFLSASDSTKAYALYVLSLSTDAVTAMMQYRGSPIVVADALDGGLFEVDPLVVEHEIHSAIDTVFARMLYPQCFKFAQSSITPDLSTGEVELNALDMEVLSAKQVIGGQTYIVPSGLERNLHTTVSSTGVLGTFDFADSSTTYVTTKRKLALGDEDASTPIDIVKMVATGAAALLLGATITESELERSKQDDQNRRLPTAAQIAWRDFLTLKKAFAEEISRDGVTKFLVNRG